MIERWSMLVLFILLSSASVFTMRTGAAFSSSTPLPPPAPTTDSSAVPSFASAQYDDPDAAIVTRQLGYLPTNYAGVAVLHADGTPLVIRAYPLAGGARKRQVKAVNVANPLEAAPFPTVYWLTHPAVNKAIGDLEFRGTIAAMEQEIIASRDLQKQLLAAHQSYAADRWRMLTAADQTRLQAFARVRESFEMSGVAGIAHAQWNLNGLVTKVKCLHAHYAHFCGQQSKGVNKAEALNPIGQRVHELLLQDFPDCLLPASSRENGNGG